MIGSQWVTVSTVAMPRSRRPRRPEQVMIRFLVCQTRMRSFSITSSEFAGNSYQAFVQEMRKISELYVDLLEHACKPFEAFATKARF
jgi:hypothetical protein